MSNELRVNVAFDLETEPIDGILDQFEPPDVKLGNLKDPEKIAEKVAKAEADRQSRCALSPFTGRIISASFAWRDISTSKICTETYVRKYSADETVSVTDANEQDLIRTIIREIDQSHRIITYNGAGFDLPFLKGRMLQLSLLKPLQLPYRKYDCNRITSTHCDAMLAIEEQFPGDPMNLGRKLATWSKLLLNREHPDELADKLAYADWFRSGDHESLRKAGEWDVVSTLLIYETLHNICSGRE